MLICRFEIVSQQRSHVFLQVRDFGYALFYLEVIMNNNQFSGYPSIDKPWLQYYSDTAKNAILPTGNMYEYMLECNKNRDNIVALNFFGKKITHQQLRKNIDLCAQALVASGVNKGDIVSLCLLTIPETVYLLYAINKIGAIANFIVLNSTDKEIKKQIETCHSKIIITIDKIAPKIISSLDNAKEKSIIIIPLSQSMPKHIAFFYNINPNNKISPLTNTIQWKNFINNGKNLKTNFTKSTAEDPAVIEYTGGTTGESKGVLLSNRAGNALAFNYKNAETIFHFSPGERFLDILPPFLAYGLFLGIHMPLCVGTECILSPDPSVQNFPAYVRKYKPNHFTGGAMHIEYLMKHPKTQNMDYHFLITAAFGGDKASPEWEERATTFFDSHHARYGIINGYGMTETAGACCTTSHELKRMIPFAKNNVKVIDIDTGNELKYGQEGEICISGPTLMDGYFQNIEATNEVMFYDNGEKWLRTGDLGYVTQDGYFIISGRLKRIFMSAGSDDVIYRVYPMKIEATISKCPCVHKCSVVGKPNGEKGYLPIAYVVLNSGVNSDFAINEISSMCKNELPESSWPVEYRFLDNLPSTPAGKVDYRALERQVLEE